MILPVVDLFAVVQFHFVMDGLTLKFTPRLHHHMKSNDIDPTMYAHPWFMTCFTQVSMSPFCFVEVSCTIIIRVP